MRYSVSIIGCSDKWTISRFHVTGNKTFSRFNFEYIVNSKRFPFFILEGRYTPRLLR